MRHYIGLIHKEAASDFGISFPDFPGCVSAGTTLDEALAMGREALKGHIRALTEASQPIPDPSHADTVMADEESHSVSDLFISLLHRNLFGEFKRRGKSL